MMYKYNQYGQDPRIIDLSITYPNGHSEFILDNLQTAEVQLEDVVAQRLLPYFDQVQIDDVSIIRDQGHQPITVKLRAQGFDPLPHAQDLELLIKEKLTGTLGELFN